MILVQDIGDIYKLTEADFEISIFWNFMAVFRSKFGRFPDFRQKITTIGSIKFQKSEI